MITRIVFICKLTGIYTTKEWHFIKLFVSSQPTIYLHYDMPQSKFYTYLIVALLILSACNNKKGNPSTTAMTTDSLADTTIADQIADSTIYGTSTEDFGMSTFSMVTDKGDTLYLYRTAQDGTDGKIYGSMQYGERYALTTRDNGEAIGVLINITELDKKLKDYEICNGKLIVNGDTTPIEKYLK